MQASVPLTRDVVLVGGGHTHALVLRKWAMRPVAGARLTVINPGVTAPYSGMLPGYVAGHYERADLDIDLVRLARFAGARLIEDAATGIDPDAQRVTLAARPDIAYDIVSVDVGITSDMGDLPGFADHAVPAKPLGPFAARWGAHLDGAAQGAHPGDVAIIGAGVAGVELALAMQYALARRGIADARVCLVEAGTPLAAMTAGTRTKLMARMAAAGIEVLDSARPVAITAQGIDLEGGAQVAAALVVGAAGATPYAWMAQSGLEMHEGFIAVDAQLRALGRSDVYAVGDCAHLTHAPRPKAGVYAVRQAPVLLHNIRADLLGQQRRSYTPQRDYLKLISLGGREALAEKLGVQLQGPALWRLKDKIDQDFMNQFRDLPKMPAPALPRDMAQGVRAELGDGQPLCGACGAKVGAGDLQAALGATAPGDDAAVVQTGGTRQVISTDYLRAFTLDPYLFGQITATHALGDIWAMGATPQVALPTVVIPRMTAALQRESVREMMAGAGAVLRDAGAEVVGGHTTQGAEMAMGLTVTGLADEAPIGLAGAKAGDALILTKPLGSGTILAAEMQARAPGEAVSAAYALMRRGQGDAAGVLAAAHAMTDVTGFGLGGHLLNMARASGVAAQVDLAAVPLMAGAADLAGAGIRSTLYAANAEYIGAALPDTPAAHLIADPQTAGGLLAAVDAVQAEGLLGRLTDLGHVAAIIGHVSDGPARVSFA